MSELVASPPLLAREHVVRIAGIEADIDLTVGIGENRDRKSTRLNSSHEWTSYAVFCLKKKISDLTIERMVPTVQWEIAERLMAKPGTAEYGALAVLVQSRADGAVGRNLSRAGV